MQQLIESFHQIGAERTDILAYDVLLDHAKMNSNRIKLHAGMLPWPYASIGSLEDPD